MEILLVLVILVLMLGVSMLSKNIAILLQIYYWPIVIVSMLAISISFNYVFDFSSILFIIAFKRFDVVRIVTEKTTNK